MEQEAIVYGCIKDIAPFGTELERIRINRTAILSLDEVAAPVLIYRSMFLVPSVEETLYRHQTEIMHFGASYRDIEKQWPTWIAQFEALLSKMYWVSAKVHLETELSGTHTFSWDASGDYHTPGSAGMAVRCEWSREGALDF
jgi:hypothetical protein